MRKIFGIILSVFFMMLFVTVNAASANISTSSKEVEVGDKVTITVKVNAVSWNVKVTGALTDTIVGANMDETNQQTTKTYTLDTSKAGKYTVSIAGDIIDETSTDYVSKPVSGTVTVTVKEKTPVNENTNENSKPNNNTEKPNANNTTTTKKSSNANISSLTLNVEGLSFKKSQTTYNIKVGENIQEISAKVKLESSKATYKISGNKNLKPGNNVVTILVTAEDGTKKTYKINVEKAGNIEDTSSALTNLIIENMILEPVFDSKVTEYVGSNIKYTDALNILPYTQAEEATYEIIGNEEFKVGENTVSIKVTSKDGSSSTEYTVTFEMLDKEETNALQVVSPYTEQELSLNETGQNLIWESLKRHSTIILLYLLALIEFIQVVYLYMQLKGVDSEVIKVRRRNNKNK